MERETSRGSERGGVASRKLAAEFMFNKRRIAAKFCTPNVVKEK